MKTKFKNKSFRILFGIPMGAIFFSACSSDDSTEIVQTAELTSEEYEILDLGELYIEQSFTRANNDNKMLSATFMNADGESSLIVQIESKDNGQLYACYTDAKGNPDFYIQPENGSMEQFKYLDNDLQPIQECSITMSQLSPMQQSYTIVIINSDNIDDYTNVDGALFGDGKESFTDCWFRHNSNGIGRICNIVSDVMGTEVYVAIAAGNALACLIYDPF